MHTLANSENPDEMLHNSVFHQCLCLLRQKLSPEKNVQFYLEIIICDPLIYSMDHPKFSISNQKEESVSA